MKIDNVDFDWTGHSGLRIKTKEKVIYIDPFKISSQAAEEKADLILITHCHYDHCSIEDIQKIIKLNTTIICPPCCQSKIARLDKIEMQIIQPGDNIKIKGFDLRAIPAYNINKQFHQKNEDWVGYILKIGDLAVYHAGDTDLIPEMEKLAGFQKLICFLPVGGKFTMDAEEAAKAALLIKPFIAVPIHYGDIIGGREDALRFKELCEHRNIKVEILEKI